MEHNHTAEILEALKIGKSYADRAKLKMLGEVAAYSDAAFERAQKESVWIKQMSDCEAIDAAIAKATKDPA